MQVIVAAAILASGPDGAGRVLAAERARPAQLAGRWEFPGGKVEPAESETLALIRECREELAVEVEPADRLGTDVRIGTDTVLRVWTARIVAGTPVAVEHRSLRWLTAGELDDVPWLPADRPLVAELARVLAVRR